MKTLLDLITSLLKAIPIFNRWFNKTPVEKKDEVVKDVDKESGKMKDTGRPTWFKGLGLGVLFSGIFFACAVGFPYKYYGMQLAAYTDGKLLGPEPSDDKDIVVCQPSEHDKGPCVVMLREDFFSLKKDYEQTKIDLRECENH